MRRRRSVCCAQRVFGPWVVLWEPSSLRFAWHSRQEPQEGAFPKAGAPFAQAVPQRTRPTCHHTNHWCRKALKLNTLTGGLLVIVSVPFSGTKAKEHLQICHDLITLQLVPRVSCFITVHVTV